jgi:hypothetical protein
MSLLRGGLLFLDRKRMRIRPSILTNPCNLPGNFHSWGVVMRVYRGIIAGTGKAEASFAAAEYAETSSTEAPYAP